MDAKLGYRSTAAQALRGLNLQGKTAVVTGGNSGFGKETVAALATAGAHVVLCCRRPDAGRKVAEELQGHITLCKLDLADLRRRALWRLAGCRQQRGEQEAGAALPPHNRPAAPGLPSSQRARGGRGAGAPAPHRLPVSFSGRHGAQAARLDG